MTNITTLIVTLTIAGLVGLALDAIASQAIHPAGHAPHSSGDASIRHGHRGAH